MGVLGAVQGWPFARQDDVRTCQNYFVLSTITILALESDHACYCFANCETCFRALLAGWSCFGWRVLSHVRPSKIPASRSFISLVPKIRLCSSGFLEWRAFLETRMPVSLTSQQLRRRGVAQSCLRVFSS